jgi:hypothetical protein
MDRKLHFSFNSPLQPGDTENQTFGCRQNNPDICGSNGIAGICAFATEDCICRKPSKVWKKKYNELKPTTPD